MARTIGLGPGGIDISDADGKFLDVTLQPESAPANRGGIGSTPMATGTTAAQEEEVPSGAAGPSKQYVIETLVEHYTKASASIIIKRSAQPWRGGEHGP